MICSFDITRASRVIPVRSQSHGGDYVNGLTSCPGDAPYNSPPQASDGCRCEPDKPGPCEVVPCASVFLVIISIHLSIAMLAILEAAMVFGALVLARFPRFHFNPLALDDDQGSLWARGLIFTNAGSDGPSRSAGA